MSAGEEAAQAANEIGLVVRSLKNPVVQGAIKDIAKEVPPQDLPKMEVGGAVLLFAGAGFLLYEGHWSDAMLAGSFAMGLLGTAFSKLYHRVLG